jgi:hypothetical protein
MKRVYPSEVVLRSTAHRIDSLPPECGSCSSVSTTAHSVAVEGASTGNPPMSSQPRDSKPYYRPLHTKAVLWQKVRHLLLKYFFQLATVISMGQSMLFCPEALSH